MRCRSEHLRLSSRLPRARQLLPGIAALVMGLLLAAEYSAAQTPANQAPQFPTTENGMRSVDENTAAEMDIGMPVAAADPENDPLTYALGGTDADSFEIVASSGQLRTKASLNYEAQSSYSVTVSVHDGKDAQGDPRTAVDATITVTVAVGNVDEDGTVTVSTAQPRAGGVLRAALSDPDGRLRSMVWQWERSSDKSTWTPISRAARWRYTPRSRDEGNYLRASVTYSDRQGAGKAASAVLALAVAEQEPVLDLSVHEFVSGLSIPWGLAFAPDGTMLFTQKSGLLRARLTDGTIRPVTADFHDLFVSGETGLMAIVVDPDFATNRRFYTCQGHTGTEVQVIAWTIDAAYAAASRADDPLVGGLPSRGRHGGCRLRFGPQGYLWIATGDAAIGTNPQNLSSLGGKVLRVDATTGTGAPANPFPSSPLIYSYGHRNIQGLALRPGTDQMWSVEHGPSRDDEINLLVSGGNYGWDPALAHGYDESVPMTDRVKFPDAVEAKWSSGDNTLATSGGIFLEGDEWGRREGRLAVASLKDMTLRVFEFAADGTLLSEVIVDSLEDTYGRLRTPMLGPDGALYVSTSNGGSRDKILRVTPQQGPAFESETATVDVPENAGIATVITTVIATDPNYDTLTYTLGGPDAASFDLDSTSGQLSTRAPLDRETKDSYNLTLSVHDGVDINGNSDTTVDDTMSVTVTVIDVDEPADISFSAAGGVTANNNALAVDENHDGSLAAFSASDPENKAGLTYTWSLGGSDQGDFAITDAGVLSFAAIPDFERPADSGGNNVYDITVRARDSDNMLGSVAVTVTVDAVNERPTIVGDAAASIEEGGTLLVGTYRAADPETALIAWQPLAGDDGDRFEFTASNGRLVFKAAPDYEDATDIGRNNVYDVTLSVSAGGHTTTFDVAVSVTNKEEGSALGLSSPQPQADADYTATLSDLDGLSSTDWTWERSMSRSGPWTAVSGAVDGVTTSVYRPVAGDVGYFLRVSAAYTDGHGPDKSRAVVSANSVKAAPVANVPPSFEDRAPTRSVAENAGARAAVGAAVTATDTDSGDVVAYELSGSALFTINSNSGQISVVADGSLDHETAPSHSVTVKASDTTNASDTVTVTIGVTDVNERPVAVADTGRAREDGDVTIDVLANDSDPEDDHSALTLRVTADPHRGRATVNEPANPGERRTITYTPRADYHGSDVFTYEVRDAGSPSLASRATVTVEVDAVNDAPTFKSATTTRSVSEGATGGGKVGAPVTATDVDNNDTLTYSLTGSEARFFAIGPRGQITVGDGVTFNIATKDTYTVTVAADDSDRDRATVEVTITVTSGPRKPPITGGGGGGGGGGPPVVVEIDGPSFAAANTETVFTAAVSDDATISSLRWTVGGPDGFTATSNAQRVSFVAPAGGAYTLSVTVDDTARRTLTGSVTLAVFGDITGHQFVNEILWLAEEGITRGCAAHSYCPSNPVTRAQMASFLARALNLEAPRQRAGFDDVDPSSAHAANIEALYAAHITTGCTQDPLAYCPSNPVTRAQMATFLARALDLEAPPQPAGFGDVDPSSAHAANIEALYAAQITTGCTQDPLAYCPSRPVTRAQMAAFLHRALRSVFVP